MKVASILLCKCLRGLATKRYQHVQREAACVFTGRQVWVFYLDFPCMVGNDEAQQYDCRQADQTLQGQRIHGALGREELTRTFLEPCRGKKNNNVQDSGVCEWSEQNVSKYKTKQQKTKQIGLIYMSCYFLLCWNCKGTIIALHLSGDNSICKKKKKKKRLSKAGQK